MGPLINLKIKKILSYKCGFVFGLNKLKITSVLKRTVLHLRSLTRFSSPLLHQADLVQGGVIRQIGMNLADNVSFFLLFVFAVLVSLFSSYIWPHNCQNIVRETGRKALLFLVAANSAVLIG